MRILSLKWSTTRQRLPVSNLVVLHYNCTTYANWRSKYIAYASLGKNESVFPFDHVSEALMRLDKPE